MELAKGVAMLLAVPVVGGFVVGAIIKHVRQRARQLTGQRQAQPVEDDA